MELLKKEKEVETVTSSSILLSSFIVDGIVGNKRKVIS